jgi:hypothetical protein
MFSDNLIILISAVTGTSIGLDVGIYFSNKCNQNDQNDKLENENKIKLITICGLIGCVTCGIISFGAIKYFK